MSRPIDPGDPVAADRDALHRIAAAADAEMRSVEFDASGWRWRGVWRGVQIGAWNDMDGVAIVADIGPWDEWVGLRGHPPDPTPAEALQWALGTLEPWLAQPDHADRIAARSAATRPEATPGEGGEP